MNTMAKTIMISNSLYKELKHMKGDNSFTEIIASLVDEKREEKLGKNLFHFFGVLKNDKEYDKIKKDLEKSWSNWSKKYA